MHSEGYSSCLVYVCYKKFNSNLYIYLRIYIIILAYWCILDYIFTFFLTFSEANDVRKQKDLSRFQKHLFKQVISPNVVEREKENEKDLKREGDKVGEGGRGREEEERREGKEGRERGQNFDREKRRHDEEKHPRKRRESEEGRRESEGGERKQRRDSHGREERASHDRSRGVDRDSIEGVTSFSSPREPPGDNELEKQLSPAPLPKKTKLEAGIEVEEEEIDTVDRRKLAATKRSTNETTMSAKERYLARKRAKLQAEREEQD